MRVSRAKSYRKWLRFFRIVYGVKPPYRVLLDGNFVHICLSHSIPIRERLAGVLQVQPDQIKLLVPRTVSAELAALGEGFQKSLEYVKGKGSGCLPVDDQAEGKGTPAEQILALIGESNEKGYLVATQDENLRQKLRAVPGCPVIYVSRTVLVLEPPSGQSKKAFERMELEKTVEGFAGGNEKAVVDEILKREREEAAQLQPKMRIKKKARAPNPLSCMKKKKQQQQQQQEQGAITKKRRRKRASGKAKDA
jgi:U3 small nucleolar RNA-associated protein 23